MADEQPFGLKELSKLFAGFLLPPILAVFVNKLFESWGVLDEPAEQIGRFLKVHVSGSDLSLLIAFLFAIALYLILLIQIRSKHEQKPGYPKQAGTHESPHIPAATFLGTDQSKIHLENCNVSHNSGPVVNVRDKASFTGIHSDFSRNGPFHVRSRSFLEKLQNALSLTAQKDGVIQIRTYGKNRSIADLADDIAIRLKNSGFEVIQNFDDYGTSHVDGILIDYAKNTESRRLAEHIQAAFASCGLASSLGEEGHSAWQDQKFVRIGIGERAD